MAPWHEETLSLQAGDFIIWRGEAIESEDGPAVLSPGMRGQVLSLHDGFHLDVAQVEPIPAKAVVQFENGMRLMVDKRMKWGYLASNDHFFSNCTLSGNSSLAVTLTFLSQVL